MNGWQVGYNEQANCSHASHSFHPLDFERNGLIWPFRHDLAQAENPNYFPLKELGFPRMGRS